MQKSHKLDIVVGIVATYLLVFKSELQTYEKSHMIRSLLLISSHFKDKSTSLMDQLQTKTCFSF